MQQAGLRDPAVVEAPTTAVRPRRRGLEIGIITLIGVLLLAAIAAGFASLHREFWSAGAFAERYVQLLADGRAADALAVDGVAVDTAELEAAGLPAYASDALLRSTALASGITDVRATSERPVEGDPDTTVVTVDYRVGETIGATNFLVESAGWSGLVPAWRFASSPLAVLDVSVHGSMRFSVNGFELDKRQVSPDGLEADPATSVPLLAFAPMPYEVAVDTPAAVAAPRTTLVNAPLSEFTVEQVAQPTAEFLDVVSEQVEGFLVDQCASQQVLQPAGCPFWVTLADRLAYGSVPQWSIVEQPQIELVPHGAYWAIAPSDGLAHIEMDVQSIATGIVTHVSEDVPFTIDGTVEILADGSAQIRIGTPLLEG